MPRRMVLVVEDSPLTRRMIRRMLEQEGLFDVIEAAEAGAALHLLTNQAVDVVLSDLHMEPLDGIALLEAVRQTPHLTHLPFIMMSVEACPTVIGRIIADAWAHYLHKPFTREQLLSAIARIHANKAA